MQKCVVSATVVACVSATTGSVNVINTVAALSHQPAIIGSQFATRPATRDPRSRYSALHGRVQPITLAPA